MKEHFKFQIKGFSPERLGVMLLVSVLAFFGIAATSIGVNRITTVNTIAELLTMNPKGVYREVEVLGYYAPGDGGGGLFVSTNSVSSTNTYYGVRAFSGTAGWSWERVRIPGVLDPMWFGVKNDGSSTDTLRWQDLANAASDGFTVAVPRGTYKSGTVTWANDLRFQGDGAKIVHEANATNHLWSFSAAQRGGIRGLTFDGNKANQASTSTNWFALLYWKGNGATIQEVTFTNFMRYAIWDNQSIGDTTLRDVTAANGHLLPTNTTFVNYAFNFSPGVSNSDVHVSLNNVWVRNSDTNAAARYFGGFYAAGSESANAKIRVSANGYYGENVGDNHVIGSAHYGGAFFELYGPNIRSAHFRDLKLKGTRYIPWKIENVSDVIGTDLYAEDVDATVGLKYTPGERGQTNAYPNGMFRNITLRRGNPEKTYGMILSAGDNGGLTNVVVDGFFGDGLFRIAEVEGSDTNGVAEAAGPIRLANFYAEGGTGIRVLNFLGDFTLENSVLYTTNGSAFIAVSTNSTATFNLLGNTIVSESGGNVTVWGASLHAERNKLNAVTGKAVWLKADDEGNKIPKLTWEENNEIIAGEVDITTSDILKGYYRDGNNNTTIFPWGLVMGPDAPLLWRYRYDTNEAANILRIQNLAVGGAALLTVGATNNLFTIKVSAADYSDTGWAGRAWLYPESNSGGLDAGSVTAGAFTRIFGGALQEGIRVEGTNVLMRGVVQVHKLESTNDVSVAGTNLLALINTKADAAGSGDDVHVNGANVTHPNLASGTNVIHHVDGTNVYSFPTNIVASQISASANIAASQLASEVLTQTEGDAAYSPLGHDHDSDYAPLAHTHSTNDVTDLDDLINNAIAASGGGSAPSGTVVNSGTPVQYALPMYNNTTGTNLAPTEITTDAGKTNLFVKGETKTHKLTSTNGVEILSSDAYLLKLPLGGAITNAANDYALTNGLTVVNNSNVVFNGGIKLPSAAGSSTLASTNNLAVNTTDKQIGVHNGTKEVAVPLVYSKEISFDPDAVCDGAVDRLFLFKVGSWAPKGITITGWRLSFEADPTTEVDLDLKRADAFIGVANSAVMDVLDTTAGVSSETSAANINGGAVVANGKVVYLEFGTAYTESNHQIIFELDYEIEED